MMTDTRPTATVARPPGPILPASHAARRLGLTVRWLTAEAEAGRLPGFKAGNRWLFDLPALERALAERVRQEGGGQ